MKQALLALDAEVLKLYDLPPALERQLLDLFTGVERKGVGCDFRGYYPPGFSPSSRSTSSSPTSSDGRRQTQPLIASSPESRLMSATR